MVFQQITLKFKVKVEDVFKDIDDELDNVLGIVVKSSVFLHCEICEITLCGIT